MSEVHYFDRRDGTRKVVAHEVKWSGPFWWAEGNGRCDCNRTLMMYNDDPDKVIECCTAHNVIVVEKIVDDGRVVYSEKQAEVLPPRVVAVLNAECLLLDMITVAMEMRKEGDLAASLEVFRQSTAALAAHTDTAAMVEICEKASELVGKVVAAEANSADPFDVEAAWEEVGDLLQDLNDLTEDIRESVGTTEPIDYRPQG
ncbi:MAG: hypothetical protein JSS83_10795 [Cyanobacteria bacterium SZAS LIN-3]|nr:hypothetical protein [Cyanobacteria bacterium SZAS LIN-3]MBS2006051.1 hypothetical protein [Cyanobacteria bacterium SZAS TMP-1]